MIKIRHFVSALVSVVLAVLILPSHIAEPPAPKALGSGQPVSAVEIYTVILPEPTVKSDEQKTQSEEIKTFVVTAYTSDVESTDKHPGDDGYGITASGTRVHDGTASCPKEYEFGTELYVPKLNKTLVCEDRGSAIHGARLDVYIASYKAAMDFGRQTLQVEIRRKTK